MGTYFRGGGVFKFSKHALMVSIFHKDPGYKVENLNKSWR